MIRVAVVDDHTIVRNGLVALLGAHADLEIVGVPIESVQSKLLAGNVGYIRLKNFQGNTTRDMQTALTSLAATPRPAGG